MHDVVDFSLQTWMHLKKFSTEIISFPEFEAAKLCLSCDVYAS